MAFRFSRRFFLLAALAIALPYEAAAQGIFDKVSIPKSVISTGQTETLGMIQVTLKQNATRSDTLTVDVSPLQITNTNASDIRVTVNGAITVGVPTVIADQGQLKIPVNAGAASGSIIIQGIRVAVAGTGINSITAKLLWDGSQNFFSNGTTGGVTSTTSISVVNKVQSGLIADPMTTNFVIYNNQVIKNTGIIIVHEGFTGAFVSSSDFGQNTPTEIQIRISDLPDGLVMHFPATVTANETAATLNIVGGNAVDVSSIGRTTVTYNYQDAGGSPDPQSFNISFTVSINGTVGFGQPTIEVSLFPIGAAVPTSAQPSTSVTRFAADYQTVLAGTSKIITQTLYWTGIDMTRDNRLSILNPSSGITNLTLTAFDASGNSLGTAPVHVSLAGNRSLDDSLANILGTGLAIATVQIQSTGSGVLASGTSSSGGVAGSLALTSQAVLGFMLPSFGDNAQLSVFNPGNVATSGKVSLLSAQGTVLGTSNISLQPLASTSLSEQQLFGTSASGQISAIFANPVVATETSPAGGGVSFVQPQIPSETPVWYVPFFAAGGGYETDLSLINPSDQTLMLSAQLFDNHGSAQGTPQQLQLGPTGQLLTTVSQLFNVSSATTGYIQIQVSPLMRWILTYYPGIIGHARIHAGSKASTAFPIVAYASDASYILNSASSGQFQGLAILNPNASAATVTVQVSDTTGTVIATATVSLKAGEFSSKLLTELFGTSVPEHSTVRVTGSIPVIAISLAGNANLTSLRAIPTLW